MTDTEARTVVPGLHPIRADTATREITAVNHDVVGTLRGWRRVTAHRLGTPNRTPGRHGG
ncbi:hypothetical protein [Embleya sp. NBC_00896]|uniref:hypothetical protein n=1 Tax=Embleya sp. NBC_00896 TaxID=2975961 RepID=UPI002F90A53B|nr:hypothetical protein OG928_46060 [Embleya sp. NBC_00896]